MAMHDFTLSHPKAEDRTFDPDLIFGIVRDRGRRVGSDYRRAQSFLKAGDLLEMAEEHGSEVDGLDDLIDHLRGLAAIDEHDPAPYQNVTLTASIDAIADAADDHVDDEVVRAVLLPHGISLVDPPRGSEASWMHETYVGIGLVPLRYSGLPLGLPGVLVRRDDRNRDLDHVSVLWENAHYMRIGDQRSVSIMATLPDTVTTDLIGTPLERLVAIPGLEGATIAAMHGGDDGRYIEIGVDI
jgi:hypothetical protein